MQLKVKTIHIYIYCLMYKHFCNMTLNLDVTFLSSVSIVPCSLLWHLFGVPLLRVPLTLSTLSPRGMTVPPVAIPTPEKEQSIRVFAARIFLQFWEGALGPFRLGKVAR